MKVLDREAHVGLIFYVDMKKILSEKICPMARDSEMALLSDIK
jgi:hypothetical protein